MHTSCPDTSIQLVPASSLPCPTSPSLAQAANDPSEVEADRRPAGRDAGGGRAVQIRRAADAGESKCQGRCGGELSGTYLTRYHSGTDLTSYRSVELQMLAGKDDGCLSLVLGGVRGGVRNRHMLPSGCPLHTAALTETRPPPSAGASGEPPPDHPGRFSVHLRASAPSCLGATDDANPCPRGPGPRRSGPCAHVC